MDVLDVACGTGNVVLEFASCMNSSSFDTLDLSEGMIDVAKSNATKKDLDNINFYTQDISKMSLSKKYDVITCSYAMFFLPNVINLLGNIVSKLKPNGIFIFTTFLKESFSPSRDILMSLLKKYDSSSAQEYDADKWENLTSIKDIEYLCKQANISDFTIESKEIRYDFIAGSTFLKVATHTKKKFVSYRLHLKRSRETINLNIKKRDRKIPILPTSNYFILK